MKFDAPRIAMKSSTSAPRRSAGRRSAPSCRNSRRTPCRRPRGAGASSERGDAQTPIKLAEATIRVAIGMNVLIFLKQYGQIDSGALHLAHQRPADRARHSARTRPVARGREQTLLQRLVGQIRRQRRRISPASQAPPAGDNPARCCRPSTDRPRQSHWALARCT